MSGFLAGLLLLLGHVVGPAAKLAVLESHEPESSATVVVDFFDQWSRMKVENELGESTPRNGASGGVTLRAVRLHPSQFPATATTQVTIPNLSAGDRAVLLYQAGIEDGFRRDDPEHVFDGVRFMALANGIEVLNFRCNFGGWTPLSADLSQLAGRTLSLQFRVDPNEGSNYDWALIGEPRLVLLHGPGMTMERAKGPGVLTIHTTRRNVVRLDLGGTRQLDVPVNSSGLGWVTLPGGFSGITAPSDVTLSFYPYGARLRFELTGVDRALVTAGETFNVVARVTNVGYGASGGEFSARLEQPHGILLLDVAAKKVPDLQPGGSAVLTWRAKALKPSRSPPTVATRLDGPTPDAAVVVAPIANRAAVGDSPEGKNGTTAWVQNGLVRIVVPSSPVGTPVRVDCKTSNGWRTVAVTSTAAFVFGNGAGGPPRGFPFRATSIAVSPGQLTIVDGSNPIWRVEARFTLTPGSRVVRCVGKLTAAADADINEFRFPDWKLFDGHAGKQGAIFPGLEYLLGDEASSGTQFAAPKFANRARPHPYKVTIPLVSVRQSDLLVSVSWDPTAEYTRGFATPLATFSSPNAMEEQRNHRIALSAPTALAFGSDNRPPPRPMFLASGQTATLTSELIIQPHSNSVLNGLEWWVGRRLPSPPSPERGGAALLDLTMEGLLRAWDADKKAWRHTNTGPVFFDPDVALALWAEAWQTKNDKLRQQAIEQVKSAVASAGMDAARDLAFHLGDAEPALARMAKEASDLIRSQRSDGSWPFQPSDEKHATLGKAGDTSSGLCARNGKTLWGYALISGDAGVIEAGKKALAFLDKLSRPEGAQTWELPLHVPDILAAAHAVDAYVTAFEATGLKRYLTRARYWALTGLPFTYLWSASDRPIMRYATVPVFGVTWFDIQPWFGVAVQWNGLEYARSLFRLAAYDKSVSWRKIAEGITQCGAQQMEYTTKGYPDDAGMYPDAYSIVQGKEEYHWDLNPKLLALDMLLSAGSDPYVQTKRVDKISVSAVGRLGPPKVDAGELTFDVIYPTGAVTSVVVSGIGHPRGVIAGGDVVSDWRYVPDARRLVVRLTHRNERMSVRVKL